MTSFGHNPTFGEGALTLETHILDFSEDIYGSELELVFFRKLRDEMRFSGPEDLLPSLPLDREARRRLWPGRGFPVSGVKALWCRLPGGSLSGRQGDGQRHGGAGQGMLSGGRA